MNLVKSIIGGYSNTGISLIFALVIALASMIWIIYKMLSYALSTYIFVDNEDLAGIADVKEVTVEKVEKIEEVENTTIE